MRYDRKAHYVCHACENLKSPHPAATPNFSHPELDSGSNFLSLISPLEEGGNSERARNHLTPHKPLPFRGRENKEDKEYDFEVGAGSPNPAREAPRRRIIQEVVYVSTYTYERASPGGLSAVKNSGDPIDTNTLPHHNIKILQRITGGSPQCSTEAESKK